MKPGKWMSRGSACVLGLGALTAGGCFLVPGLKPGGSQRTNDEYTYVSTPWEPLTVTLYDRRDDTPLWTVDVPVGSKVSIRFYNDKETSGTTRMPDMMKWEIFDESKTYRRLASSMAVPGAEARLLQVSLREEVPQYPDEQPGEMEYGSPDRDWAPVQPRTFRGVPTQNTSGNYYRED